MTQIHTRLKQPWRIREALKASEIRRATEGNPHVEPEALADSTKNISANASGSSGKAVRSTEDRETGSEVKDNLTQVGKVDEDPVDHIE